MRLVEGVEGKLSRAVYLATPPPPFLENKSLILGARPTHLELSKCEDVSVIIIIHDKVKYFHMLGCRAGSKLSRAVYLAPCWIPKHKFWMLIPLI